MGTQAALQRTASQVPRSVLYDSFHGSYSDSPRAIYEELVARGSDLTSTWVTRPGTADFPAAAAAVNLDRLRGQRRIGGHRLVVANVQMPSSFQKRHGMFYLQTWHGTPLKRLGADHQGWTNTRAQQRQLRDYQRWDLLLSPNRFSTEIFRRAFRFEGEIYESGYPRNDILNDVDRESIRRRVRTQLGIAPDQRAVLYAPTFRDDQWDAVSGRPRYVHKLDIPLLREKLAPESILLFRLHERLRRDVAPAAPDTFVRDVSNFSDIGLLYLAADVLLTDYSSVMFDFAVTGKPMLFYTYDLEHYRDSLRGFYFDFESEAPGPLCRDTGDVASALEDVDALVATNALRYKHFQGAYCYLEDGRAASRVVDRILALV